MGIFALAGCNKSNIVEENRQDIISTDPAAVIIHPALPVYLSETVNATLVVLSYGWCSLTDVETLI